MSEKTHRRSNLSFDPIVALKPCLSEKGVNYFKNRIQTDSETDDRIVSKISSEKVYNFDILIFETSDKLSVLDVLFPETIEKVYFFDRDFKENIPLKAEMLNCISQHNKEFLEGLGIKTDLVDVLQRGNYQINQLFRLCGFNVRDFRRLSFVKKLYMFPFKFIVRGYSEGKKLKTPIFIITSKLYSDFDTPLIFEREQAIKTLAGWLIEKKLIQLNLNEIFLVEKLFNISENAEKYAMEFFNFSEVLFSKRDKRNFYEFELAYSLAEYYLDSVYQLSLYAYEELVKMAEEKGMLFVDTNFKFGIDKNGEICFGNEVGTPDSSRFVSKDEYEKTGIMKSLDKHILQDYCNHIDFTGDPDQNIPELPDNLLKKLTANYLHIAELICGEEKVKIYKN